MKLMVINLRKLYAYANTSTPRYVELEINRNKIKELIKLYLILFYSPTQNIYNFFECYLVQHKHCFYMNIYLHLHILMERLNSYTYLGCSLCVDMLCNPMKFELCISV